MCHIFAAFISPNRLYDKAVSIWSLAANTFFFQSVFVLYFLYTKELSKAEELKEFLFFLDITIKGQILQLMSALW